MTDAPEPRRWLSARAAADYLDCDPSTIDRLARGGQLTRYRVGGMTRFDLHQIDALVLSGAGTHTAGATRAG